MNESDRGIITSIFTMTGITWATLWFFLSGRLKAYTYKVKFRTWHFIMKLEVGHTTSFIVSDHNDNELFVMSVSRTSFFKYQACPAEFLD